LHPLTNEIDGISSKEVLVGTIGFIGTGLIGNPMARRLAQKGFCVKAADKNPEALRSVLDAGAEPLQDPASLLEAAAVFIVVNTMDQVNEVLLGYQGLVPAWKGHPMPLLVVMSTVSPEDMQRLNAQLAPYHPRLLDAPISGGPFLAEHGRLAIMVGGSEEELTGIRPVLEALGESIFHVGPLGSGMAMKLVNNVIGLASILAVPEALALGVHCGLEVDTMVKVINAGTGKTFLTENWPLVKVFLQGVLDQGDPFGVGNALFTTGRKDLDTAKRWATSHGFDTPVVDTLLEAVSGLDTEFLIERIRIIVGHMENTQGAEMT
jgi:3-hydroxyisobutyrate dehydrogenase-like beta-hydroxyacid dehydrogenase